MLNHPPVSGDHDDWVYTSSEPLSLVVPLTTIVSPRVDIMNNWTAVKEVRKKSVARGNTRAVLEAIARHISRESGRAWVGKERIAELVGCHRDNVRKYRRELEKLGELEADIQGGPGRSMRDKPNLYSIPFLIEGVDSPPEPLCICDGVRKKGEIYYPYRQQDTESLCSGGGTPTAADQLKESGIYPLVPDALRDKLFRNLPPEEPEIWLLRSLLVERTGQSPPPGWKSGTTRAEAIVQLGEMFGQECVAC